LIGSVVLSTWMLSTWFPEAVSDHALLVDGPFRGVSVLAVCLLAVFVGLALVLFRLYRRQDKNQQGAITGRANPVFQTVWVLLLLGFAVHTFRVGLPGFMDQAVEPYGAYEVGVSARQWGWDFVYPNGHTDTVLHVPADRAVRLNMTSADVAHSLAVPALRIEAAIEPGQDNSTWFEAHTPGTYELRSNTYSGEGFAGMKTELVVHDSAGFDKWLDGVSDIFKGRDLAEVGELLYTRQGCVACHTTDGTRLVGPSFKDLYGHKFETADGKTILADDAYIHESIVDPAVSVIAGYPAVMVSYAETMTDREIEAITAWLQTLAGHGGAAKPAAEEEK